MKIRNWFSQIESNLSHMINFFFHAFFRSFLPWLIAFASRLDRSCLCQLFIYWWKIERIYKVEDFWGICSGYRGRKLRNCRRTFLGILSWDFPGKIHSSKLYKSPCQIAFRFIDFKEKERPKKASKFFIFTNVTQKELFIQSTSFLRFYCIFLSLFMTHVIPNVYIHVTIRYIKSTHMELGFIFLCATLKKLFLCFTEVKWSTCV